MAYYIPGWIIACENGKWIAIGDDGDHVIKGIESLDQLIDMIDQIDHPEACE